jgi:hypothetical protein
MNATTTQRHSQRLFLQVRVIVGAQLADRSDFSEETRTIVLNAHGALVEMATSLDQGQTATLWNVSTSEKIECKVILVKPEPTGKFTTAVEFANPNPDFWRISFPPNDWSTRSQNSKNHG